MKAQRREKVSTTLRIMIKRSRLTQYAIAKKTGIPASSLSRFVKRQQGLSLDAVDRLAKLFGLGLAVRWDFGVPNKDFKGNPCRLTKSG